MVLRTLFAGQALSRTQSMDSRTQRGREGVGRPESSRDTGAARDGGGKELSLSRRDGPWEAAPEGGRV